MLLHRSGIYQAARVFRLLSTFALVVIVLFVGASIYSVAQVRPSSPAGSSPSYQIVGNSSVELHSTIVLSNPGWFAINDLTIDSQVRLPGSAGAFLGESASPVMSAPAGGAITIPVNFTFPLTGTVDETLLTDDLTLPASVWVNATYASVFSVRLVLPENLSWGAPFEGLNLTPGAPIAQKNGTEGETIGVAFADDASLPVSGTFDYALEDAQGAECASSSLSLDVNAHTSYRGGSTVYLPPSCLSGGESIVSSFQGSFGYLPLPKETFE